MDIARHHEWKVPEPNSADWLMEPRWWKSAECRRPVPPLEPKAVLAHVFEAIASSHRILDLKDNWDDEGSKSYSEPTLRRATEFVLAHALWVWEHHELVVDAPRITPGPEGSIDIHWEDEGRELLVNLPADPNEKVTFYGDDKGRDGKRIKGALGTVSAEDHGLLVWLTKAQ